LLGFFAGGELWVPELGHEFSDGRRRVREGRGGDTDERGDDEQARHSGHLTPPSHRPGRVHPTNDRYHISSSLRLSRIVRAFPPSGSQTVTDTRTIRGMPTDDRSSGDPNRAK